jgi:coproporphyrinogen III oxidase-like Fe-S oxidoreductase
LIEAPLDTFLKLGLLEWVQNRLRLTREGLMVSDSLWPAFL